MEIALAFHVGPHRAEPFGPLRRTAVDRPLAVADVTHPSGGDRALDPVDDAAGVGQRRDQVLAQRCVLEQPADHVEHLVGVEVAPDRVELVEQDRQHPPLAGLAGDQVHDAHVVPLAVAVDAAHALLQPRRVPGNVVIHHQPAELQVDALAGGVGGDQIAGAVRPPKALHLLLALGPRHAAVELRDPPREPEPLQAADQVIDRVAVLAEDQPLLVGVAPVFEHLAQLLELGLVPGLDQPPGARAQLLQPADLAPHLLDRHRGHRAEHRVLVRFAALAQAVAAGVVIRAVGVEEIGAKLAVQAALPPVQVRGAQPARLQVVDGSRQFLDPAFQGAQQRPGRAGQPALEHAHRQPHRRPVAQGAAVGVGQVGGGPVVERLLAVRPAAQVVAEGVAGALPVERAAVQADQLLLGAADEVAVAPLRREAAERFAGGEDLRVEQSPEMVIGRVLAHVRRCREQQQVPRRPPQAGEPAVGSRAAGQRLGQLVAPPLADAAALGGGAQLVRLVEHHQVVGSRGRCAQRRERPLAGQGVERHDGEVAVRPPERIPGAGGDAEAEAKEGAQLALPVADQAGRRDDEHAPDTAPRQHFADVEPGHDRLAGAGVVGQQEAQRLLPQHPFVDRDALVRQRIDPRRLAGEGRVELVAEGQPPRLRHRGDRVGIAGEVELEWTVSHVVERRRTPRPARSGSRYNPMRRPAESGSCALPGGRLPPRLRRSRRAS